jgi:hypothetical protein
MELPPSWCQDIPSLIFREAVIATANNPSPQQKACEKKSLDHFPVFHFECPWPPWSLRSPIPTQRKSAESFLGVYDFWQNV